MSYLINEWLAVWNAAGRVGFTDNPAWIQIPALWGLEDETIPSHTTLDLVVWKCPQTQPTLARLTADSSYGDRHWLTQLSVMAADLFGSG